MPPSSIRTSTSRSGTALTMAALVPSTNVRGTRTPRVVTARTASVVAGDGVVLLIAASGLVRGESFYSGRSCSTLGPDTAANFRAVTIASAIQGNAAEP